MAHRPAPATSSERHAAWQAGRQERSERLRGERERQQRGSVEADWRPQDWDDDHGAWLVAVPELLLVPVPDLVSGRARPSKGAADERVEAAVAELDELLTELGARAEDVLDEEEADKELREVRPASSKRNI